MRKVTKPMASGKFGGEVSTSMMEKVPLKYLGPQYLTVNEVLEWWSRPRRFEIEDAKIRFYTRSSSATDSRQVTESSREGWEFVRHPDIRNMASQTAQLLRPAFATGQDGCVVEQDISRLVQ